jgi:23S rRNA (adenine1618-N6)-methyltransferase
MIRNAIKERLHPRNRFRGGYDFPSLIARSPGLGAFVAPNVHGDASIDYASPEAVKALNQALLADAYDLHTWDVPLGYLCPPIPGRSDYLHYLADLLSDGDDTAIPRGNSVAILDIGTGASCIYPLIGASEYGWRFVGSEIDPAAVKWARSLVADNGRVRDLIEIRQQTSPLECFSGVIQRGEVFDLSMCNPPFHASAEEAAEGNRRKRRHLGRGRTATPLNFGGTSGELWCCGGELGFVQRMIAESARWPQVCRWFTTLVSNSEHLPSLRHALRQVHAADVKTIDMVHGQKKSRILAWTFTKHA